VLSRHHNDARVLRVHSEHCISSEQEARAEISPYLFSVEKRLFDLWVSGLALLMLVPLLLIIAVAIRIDGAGPVLFRQERNGQNGERFQIYKFRTMRVQEVATGFEQARRGDPRVTRVGRLLRRTSFDELPQLLNVLRGDMSLVGPRPHPVELDGRFEPVLPTYERRLLARPGITGLAQINGARGETRTIGDMAQRLDFDLRYLEHATPMLDLKVMLRSVGEVLFSKHAH
jgi:putative colanic acid biosysnthesis UDP-glucose lipid carrier transferase